MNSKGTVRRRLSLLAESLADASNEIAEAVHELETLERQADEIRREVTEAQARRVEALATGEEVLALLREAGAPGLAMEAARGAIRGTDVMEAERFRRILNQCQEGDC